MRHDTGNKLGFLKAMVYFALHRPDLAEPFRRYLEEAGREGPRAASVFTGGLPPPTASRTSVAARAVRFFESAAVASPLPSESVFFVATALACESSAALRLLAPDCPCARSR